MKKTKARLSGITQEKEMQIEEPHDLKSGATQEEEVQPEKHVQPKKPHNLRGGGQEEKKTTKISRIGKGGGYSNTRRRGIQDTIFGNRTTY